MCNYYNANNTIPYLQYISCKILCIFVSVTSIIVKITISFYTHDAWCTIEVPDRNHVFLNGNLGRAYESKKNKGDRPFKDL